MLFKMHPKFRVKCWGNSTVASFIRRIFNAPDKPKYATMKEWNEWTRNQLQNHKVAYWLTETGLKKLQNFVYYPYDVYNSLKYYIEYRCIYKNHYLHTRLKVGEYHSISERILHGVFETLVDYVEIDLAKREYFIDPPKIYNNFKWNPYSRNRIVGINYLLRMIKEKEDGYLTQRANLHLDIFNLYNWWNSRPYRRDPSEVSGLDKFNIQYRNTDTLFPEFSSKLIEKRYNKLLDKTSKLMDTYEKEDQEQLIKLISIINNLT